MKILAREELPSSRYILDHGKTIKVDSHLSHRSTKPFLTRKQTKD